MKDVCYRTDDGLVLAIKPEGSIWSQIERGSTGALSVVTVSVHAEVMDDWMSAPYDVDGTEYQNNLYYLDGSVIVGIDEVGSF